MVDKASGLGRPRVGVVSLFGMYNFGNRLQGYAVHSILQAQGLLPTTIVAYRKLGLSLVKAKMTARFRRQTSLDAARERRFVRFVSDQDIRYLLIPGQIRALQRRYDWFVVGSDQVWHPAADLYPGTKFLEFARPEQRIALSPSFGLSELPSSDHYSYGIALRGFSRLSIREQEGACLITSLTDKTPWVLPDPTIGLSRQEWDVVASNGEKREGRYVLLYFLGGVAPERRQMIHSMAMRLDASVIDLADRTSPFWASGPQDFLALIRAASLVLTDSYHASIFSTIFEVPFYVFAREEKESTYSRITTLFQMLSLEAHEGALLRPGDPVSQDFTTSTKMLEKRRIELLEFVRDSIAER